MLISSDGGVAGAQDFAAYCTSKHGVIGLMRTAALDFGPRGVRVNAVAPSFVDTPMADRIFAGIEDERDYWRGVVPLGRFATPAEVADAVLHLLMEATYTNGHVYRIDGGSTTGYYQPPA
ncbi:MAG: 3-oxoacyl-(acyl-carrier-protein) reductase protein [Aeromicrobium sp.]|nr:3-oxoacyl-(acyl-carrier-protein) reductase protein [Aeromicrobium sp.]